MKKIVGILAIVLVVVLLLLALAGVFFTKYYLEKIQRIDTETIEVVAPEREDFEQEETAAPSPAPESEEAITWDDVEALQDDDLINILLVGQDTRGEERARSDSMILLSFNPKLQKASLTSFLRDTYVKLPDGYSYNRLNAPYRFGGFPLLYETMKINFGVTIDGGVEVDFQGFQRIIDLLDGVDIMLTGPEADYMQLPAGLNHLNGEQALTYARIRSIDGDFNRTERQRNVLTSLFQKLHDMDLQTALSLADEILGLVQTDMTDDEILKLIIKTVPVLSDLELSTHRVPADDAYYMTMRSGMSVLVPDLEKIREDLQEYLPFS